MNSSKLWFGLSVIFLILIVGIVIVLEDETQITQKSPEVYIPLVSVVEVRSQTNAGNIKIFAQVNPRWGLTIKSRVSGQVLEVSEKAFAGQVVAQGDILIRIEKGPYLVALREAEQAVLSAEIELTRQQARADLAEADWAAAENNSSPTQLALNIPQLELARQSLKVEQSRLAVTHSKLADIKILAPFSGIITQRTVSIGQNIVEGEDLLEIVGRDILEIAVSLGRQQWEMLAENWQEQNALIRDTDGIEIGRAVIKRGGGFLDQKTRQYRLFLEIENDERSQVLPGDYVGVELPGRNIAKTLKIPQTSLTRDGLVWYVDEANNLRKFTAQVLFYSDAHIIVKTPILLGNRGDFDRPMLIAITPLASYLAGSRVEGVLVEGN